MTIDFSLSRWEKVLKTAAKFWDGTLERPVIPIYLEKDPPVGLKTPKLPHLTPAMFHDFHIPVSDLIERMDYDLACRDYMGDSYPMADLSIFGVGILSGFLGAEGKVVNGSEIWFDSPESMPLNAMHFEYDGNNLLLNRVKEFCETAGEHWQGEVLVGMPDLGGIIDTLSVFRTAGNLCMDLYDDPDEVKRLINEIEKVWYQCYEEIRQIQEKYNPGYADAFTVLSEKPMYTLQSDFSYLLGTQMWHEFVFPVIERGAKRIDHTIYHLDGPQQINHLDYLLGIEELDGIQWMPGAGNPDTTQWPELHQKIHMSGKRIMLLEGPQTVLEVGRQIGTTKGIVHWMWGMPETNKDYLVKILNELGVEQ